jgi:hypothetical protein
MMQELNEQDLEQVVGGTANGTTYGGAGGGASSWSGYSYSDSSSVSTIQPHLIQTTASNNSSAYGWNSYAGSSAGSTSYGTVN